MIETNEMALCLGSKRKGKNDYGKDDEYKNRGEYIYKENLSDDLCCPLSFRWIGKGNNVGEDQLNDGYRSKPNGSVLKLGWCNWRKNMILWE